MVLKSNDREAIGETATRLIGAGREKAVFLLLTHSTP